MILDIGFQLLQMAWSMITIILTFIYIQTCRIPYGVIPDHHHYIHCHIPSLNHQTSTRRCHGLRGRHTCYSTRSVPDPGGGGHRGQLPPPPPKVPPNLIFTFIFLTNSVDLLICCKDSMIPPISMLKIREHSSWTPTGALLLDLAAHVRPPLRVCPPPPANAPSGSGPEDNEISQ